LKTGVLPGLGPLVVGVVKSRPVKGEGVADSPMMRLAMTVGRVVKVKVFMMISDW
jgi:hypothetical protein